MRLKLREVVCASAVQIEDVGRGDAVFSAELVAEDGDDRPAVHGVDVPVAEVEVAAVGAVVVDTDVEVAGRGVERIEPRRGGQGRAISPIPEEVVFEEREALAVVVALRFRVERRGQIERHPIDGVVLPRQPALRL